MCGHEHERDTMNDIPTQEFAFICHCYPILFFPCRFNVNIE